MDEFVRKFDDDYKAVQMLSMTDRVKQFRFDMPARRSVKNELFVNYISGYTTDGLINLSQFVKFLDNHLIKTTGDEEE